MMDVGEALELLSEDRRRYVVYYLYENDRPVHIEELIESIVDKETENPSSEAFTRKYNQVRMALRHNHLERADEFECISYDRASETVELVTVSTVLEVLLGVTKGFENQ